MVLLHELAHLRRWDNLVNLLQRFVESLLFFHPGGVVAIRLGAARARALLRSASWSNRWASRSRMRRCWWRCPGRLARGIRPAARHGRSPGDDPDSSALKSGGTFDEIDHAGRNRLAGCDGPGCAAMLGSQAAQTKPADLGQKTSPSVPGTAVNDMKDMPALDAVPVTEQLARKKAAERKPRVIRVHPANPREISLFMRDERRLQIVELPLSPDGVRTFRCKGGIEIVCNSRKFGTIRIIADEAVIDRVQPERNEDEPVGGPRGETWYEDADAPMDVHLRGNVILRLAGKGEQQTVRAAEADYNFVTDRLLAVDAELEVDAPGLGTPIKIVSPKIEQFHPTERQPDGSLVPSQRREIRAGHEQSPKVVTPFYRSTPPRDPKDPKR